MTYFYEIAIDVNRFSLPVYSSPSPIPIGSRVAVRLRGKTLAGVAWRSLDAPGIDPSKVKPVERVFEGEGRLPAFWRNFVELVASYYHHDLGPTVFTGLPSAYSIPRPLPQPLARRDAIVLGPKARERMAAEAAADSGWALAELLLRQDCPGQGVSLAEALAASRLARSRLAKWQSEGWARKAGPDAPEDVVYGLTALGKKTLNDNFLRSISREAARLAAPEGRPPGWLQAAVGGGGDEPLPGVSPYARSEPKGLRQAAPEAERAQPAAPKTEPAAGLEAGFEAGFAADCAVDCALKTAAETAAAPSLKGDDPREALKARADQAGALRRPCAQGGATRGGRTKRRFAQALDLYITPALAKDKGFLALVSALREGFVEPSAAEKLCQDGPALLRSWAALGIARKKAKSAKERRECRGREMWELTEKGRMELAARSGRRRLRRRLAQGPTTVAEALAIDPSCMPFLTNLRDRRELRAPTEEERRRARRMETARFAEDRGKAASAPKSPGLFGQEEAVSVEGGETKRARGGRIEASPRVSSEAEAVAAAEAAPEPGPARVRLNEEQSAARAAIRSALGGFAAFLLLGVTGSGKTEVYMEAMADALNRGKQALFLVPEINLTPQLMDRLRRRFPGVDCVVAHSAASASERLAAFGRASRGEAGLVVGTRLSVFTPMPNLGLIVVDEEHDRSYKQEDGLKYNARDLAVWAARQRDCPVVLGSATPSMESYKNALDGRYALLRLTRRANDSALPEIELQDMKGMRLNRGLSERSLALLRENFERGDLSLVFINRRGYAPAYRCMDCMQAVGCPDCSGALVLHLQDRCLRCHHCGYETEIPRFCPRCGSDELAPLGDGTQKAELAVREAIPEARVVRVDADTASGKGAWEEIYRQANKGEIDVLVGTQMLAKGHDFDNLSLVVVAGADSGLHGASLRAKENLFSTLCQVAGRAGRRKGKRGVAVIQTREPDNLLYDFVARRDYEGFARGELEEREKYGIPPCGHAAYARADADDYETAEDFLQNVRERAQARLGKMAQSQNAPIDASLSGPVAHWLQRLKGKERALLWIEGPKRSDLHKAIAVVKGEMERLGEKNRSVVWAINVDPCD